MSEEITRRSLVVSGLTAGFALAVQPVSAATITTDTKGLVAGEVSFKAPDGVIIPAYRAHPAKADIKRPAPVVLVIQEIFGVHEHIKDICRRLAKKGYYAIAPQLYVRQGDVSKITDISKIMSDVVAKVPDAQVMSDLDATVTYARASGVANASKLAITGFCWGGRIVWLYAAHNPSLKAGVAWYGRLTGQPSELQPKHPLDIAADLKAPVLGLYGGLDKGIPQTNVEQMRAALKEAKGKSEIIVYADAEHGFNADYRPSFNEKDAKDGFNKLLSWFKKNGVA
jgi:carboxymethylenebutenolidase